MPGPRRARARAAADALVTVAPLASRWIERLLAGHDPPLTVAQLLAMRAIEEEDVSGSELARRTGVSGPAISQLIAGLVDAGLLVRAELVQDRRRRALTLTSRGHQALRSAEDLLGERLSSLLAELPRPEAEALSRGLLALAAVLSGAPPPRRPPPPPRPPVPTPRRGPRTRPREH